MVQGNQVKQEGNGSKRSAQGSPSRAKSATRSAGIASESSATMVAISGEKMVPESCVVKEPVNIRCSMNGCRSRSTVFKPGHRQRGSLELCSMTEKNPA